MEEERGKTKIVPVIPLASESSILHPLKFSDFRFVNTAKATEKIRKCY